MINAQTNENIGVNREILGVLGENYTIEKYKSRHNKTYLTLQVFIDNILQKDLYIVSINGDSFWIKKKESTTFIVSPKQSYEVCICNWDIKDPPYYSTKKRLFTDQGLSKISA